MDQEEENRREERLQKVRQVLQWLDLHEWVVVVLLLVIVGSGWSFVSLSSEVSEQDEELTRLDERLLLALREPDDLSDPIGSARVESVMRDVTALGSPLVLSFIVLFLVIFLWLYGQRRVAVFLLVAIIGGALFSQVLKEIVARQRPDLVPLGAYANSFSFPSGHTMTAAVTYLTLGTLLATSLNRSALKTYVIAVAALLTIAVGISRVYLGVHWPSDVLGGWMAGTVWALLMWLIDRWFKKR